MNAISAPLPGWNVEEPPAVRQVSTTDAAVDIAAVADVLATAFTDSPLQVLLPGDHNARKIALRRGFASLAGWAASYGAVYLRTDGAAAAIWLPTGTVANLPGPLTPAAGSGVPASADEAVTTAARTSAPGLTGGVFERFVQSLLPSQVPQPAVAPAYLIATGVDPDERRTGAGHQLLAAHQQTLDDLFITAYAIAIDPLGQRLLASHGYQPHHVTSADPTLTIQWMTRPPQNNAGGTS